LNDHLFVVLIPVSQIARTLSTKTFNEHVATQYPVKANISKSRADLAPSDQDFVVTEMDEVQQSGSSFGLHRSDMAKPISTGKLSAKPDPIDAAAAESYISLLFGETQCARRSARWTTLQSPPVHTGHSI
jgi:hypothetical protein